RASGGLCLFARLRRWLGCLGDKGDKAGASVGAVLLLRAITAGFDDDDAILGGTLPRKGDRSLPHPLGEVWGIRRIKAQLDSSGDLVDVLSARTGGADEVFLQLAFVDTHARCDAECVVHVRPRA